MFAVQDLIFEDSPAAVAVVVDLVHSAETPWQRTMIGAAPLEDLVNDDSGRYLDAIDKAIASDTRFLPVLRAVWPRGKPAKARIEGMIARLEEAQRYEADRRERKRGTGRYSDTT